MGVLAAVCDADLHPLEAIRHVHSDVRIFDDYATMFALADLNAVVVALPAQLHAEVALAAIAAGLDVFVEKPLALNVNDAQAVVDAAREKGRTIVVGHLLLYHPAVRIMLGMVRAGAIGDLRHLRARRTGWGRLRSHEDVWWSFAPHDVAVMLELFGEAPHSAVWDTSAYVQPHIADAAYASFRFSLGRTAHVAVSWIDPEKVSRFDVFGSRGVLTFVDGNDGGSLTLTPCGDRLGVRGEPELWREDARTIDVPRDEPLEVEMREFCQAVRGGPLPPSQGEAGLEVVRALSLVAPREAVGCP